MSRWRAQILKAKTLPEDFNVKMPFLYVAVRGVEFGSCLAQDQSYVQWHGGEQAAAYCAFSICAKVDLLSVNKHQNTS